MPTARTAEILDCTIRDGSYVVDYQFTMEDTAIVARGLAAAGIRYIEVGHGRGLNAQQSGKGTAALSDIEYITAARSGISGDARVGSFFIPGIGTPDSMRAAAGAGLDFIRVGVDVDEFAKLAPFVQQARSLGLEVWANLMKSYLVPPAEFAAVVRRVGELGVDVVALVDSAGGMTPDDVAEYTEAALLHSPVPLAFHGHDNLTLAVANCLRFVECGGRYVDGSLAGLGRSGGNAATEVMAALLGRSGRLARDIDWARLIEFADAVMAFCVPFHAHPRAAEIAAGLNRFHSSFTSVAAAAAERAHASLYRTILRLPESSRKRVTAEAAESAAVQAAAESADHRVGAILQPLSNDLMQRLNADSLSALAQRLQVQKGKSPQRRVITVACAPEVTGSRVGPLRGTAGTLVAHIEVGDPAALKLLGAALGDACELWIVDRRLTQEHTRFLAKPVLRYDDDAVVAQAVSDLLQAIGAESVALTGSETSRRIAMSRMRQAVCASGPVDALVACDALEPASEEEVARVRDGGALLLIRASAATDASAAQAREKGLRLWRLDCGAALVAEAERLANTYYRFRLASGERELEGDVRVLAGGAVGRKGDIVVDHLNAPRFILGEADGRGGICPLPADAADRAEQVQHWILDQWNL